MQLLLVLLILSAVASGSEAQQPDDVNREFTFEQQDDTNFDHWPDGWTRRKGPDYPHFIQIGIVDSPSPNKNRYLSIRLDGGAAGLSSPTIRISPLFGYHLTARVRTQDLNRDHAQITLIFYDKQGNALETLDSPAIGGTHDWQTVHIGPNPPRNDAAVKAVIGLHVVASQRPDLRGEVCFDDVQFERLPRMSLRASHPSSVYTSDEQVEITYDFSGIHDPTAKVRFELYELLDDGIRHHAKPVVVDQYLAWVPGTPILDADGVGIAGYRGSTSWRPKITGNGLYRVRAELVSSPGEQIETATVAVVPPGRPQRGEFGWSLAHAEKPLSMADLARLLPRAGVHWVKIPVWRGAADDSFGDRVVRLTEHLAASNIEVIGILARPPDETDLAKKLGDGATIADIASLAPSTWLPMLNPIMTRLSLRIRWWQLGVDHDTSFVGYPDLAEKISSLRKELYRFGQDVNLGIGWRWITETPDDDSPPWEFLQFSAQPALTADELASYLEVRDDSSTRRWALIEPLPQSGYTLRTRVRDLVQQMMAAKIGRADAAFVPHPFDAQRGIMNDDGSPAELFLPWRTTAVLLAGAEYVGDIRLPEGSKNHIFRRADGRLVMAVWNDKPTTEKVFLGEETQLVDVWGRETTPATAENKQVLKVGFVPTFAVDISSPVAYWRLATRFEQTQVASEFARPHANAVNIRNSFGQGTGGTARLVVPNSWNVSPRKLNFKVAAGQQLAIPFDIVLDWNASSGRQPIRIDFDITAGKAYHFSVYRDIEIGVGAIEVECETRLDDQGRLVVEQRMTSRLDKPLDFKCQLIVDRRKRKRKHVFQLGNSPDLQTYRYENGEELLGREFWLHLEELNGPRVFNYVFTAEP